MFGKTRVQATLPPTQDHVLVQAVQDGCIILKTGDMAAAVEVEGIDLTRLTDDGRLGLLAQYQNLLTTLRFPYQFIIARKAQRLQEYLDYVEQQSKQRQREGMQAYTDHLLTFVEFMQDVVRRVNPQVPLYLLVLPYDPLSPEERVRSSDVLRLDQYRRGVDELERRCQQIIRGLTRLGLGARRLGDYELTAVLHRVYHPSIPDYLMPPTARAKSSFARGESGSTDHRIEQPVMDDRNELV